MKYTWPQKFWHFCNFTEFYNFETFQTLVLASHVKWGKSLIKGIKNYEFKCTYAAVTRIIKIVPLPITTFFTADQSRLINPIKTSRAMLLILLFKKGTQCGNWRIFLLLGFYVKSILSNLEYLAMYKIRHD